MAVLRGVHPRFQLVWLPIASVITVALLLTPSATAGPSRVLLPSFPGATSSTSVDQHQSPRFSVLLLHAPSYNGSTGGIRFLAKVMGASCVGFCRKAASVTTDLFLAIPIPAVKGTSRIAVNFSLVAKVAWGLTPGTCAYSYRASFSCLEETSVLMATYLSLADRTIGINQPLNGTMPSAGGGSSNSSGCYPTYCWVSNSAVLNGSMQLNATGPVDFTFPRPMAPHHKYELYFDLQISLDVRAVAINTRMTSGPLEAALNMATLGNGFRLISVSYY